MTKYEIIKSRTAPAGTTFKMVFDQTNGFDEELSLWVFLVDNKLATSGSWCYLNSMPDFRFRMSEIKDRLATSPEFKKAFYDQAKALLESHIRVPQMREATRDEEIEETVEEA